MDGVEVHVLEGRSLVFPASKGSVPQDGPLFTKITLVTARGTPFPKQSYRTLAVPRAPVIKWASRGSSGVPDWLALGESLAKTTALLEASIDVSVFAERPNEIQDSRPGSKKESKNSTKDAPAEVARTKTSLLGRALPVSLASVAAQPGMAQERWLELMSKSGKPFGGEIHVSLKVLGGRKDVRAALSLPLIVNGEEIEAEDVQEPVSNTAVVTTGGALVTPNELNITKDSDDDAISDSADRSRRARLAKEKAARLRDELRQVSQEGPLANAHKEVDDTAIADASSVKEAALRTKIGSESQRAAIYDTLAAAAAQSIAAAPAKAPVLPQSPPSPPRMSEAEVAAANALALYEKSIRGSRLPRGRNRGSLSKTAAVSSVANTEASDSVDNVDSITSSQSLPPEMLLRLSQLALNGPAKKRAAAAATSNVPKFGGKRTGGPAVKAKLSSAVPRVPLRDGSAQHASLQHSRTHGILPLGANVSASTQLEAHAISDRGAVTTLLSTSANLYTGAEQFNKRFRKDPRAATALTPLARAVLPKLSIMVRKRLLSKRFDHWRLGWQNGWEPPLSFSSALRSRSDAVATDWLNFGRGDIIAWRVARDATATRLQQTLLLGWRIKRARAWRVVAHAALQQERDASASAYANAVSLGANLEATAAAQRALEEEAVAAIVRCWHAWSKGPRVLRLALRGHLALAARNFATPPLNQTPPSAEYLTRALATRARPLLSPYDLRLLHMYPPPVVETYLKHSSPPQSSQGQRSNGEEELQTPSLPQRNQTKKIAASSFVDLLKTKTKPGSLKAAASPSGESAASITKAAPAFEGAAVVFAEKLAFAEAMDNVAQTCATLYPHFQAKQPKCRRRNPQNDRTSGSPTRTAHESRAGSSSSKRVGRSGRRGQPSPAAGATFATSSLSGYHAQSSWWVLVGLPCLEYTAKLAAMPVKNTSIRPLMGAPPVAWLASLKLCQALLRLERASAAVELREWPKRREELWLMRHEEERQRVMESFDHGALHKAQELKMAEESQRQKEAAKEAERHKAYFRERAKREAVEEAKKQKQDQREVELQRLHRVKQARLKAEADARDEAMGRGPAAVAANIKAHEDAVQEAQRLAKLDAKKAAVDEAQRIERESLRLPSIKSKKNTWWAVRATEVREAKARAEMIEAQRRAKIAAKKARDK